MVIQGLDGAQCHRDTLHHRSFTPFNTLSALIQILCILYGIHSYRIKMVHVAIVTILPRIKIRRDIIAILFVY